MGMFPRGTVISFRRRKARTFSKEVPIHGLIVAYIVAAGQNGLRRGPRLGRDYGSAKAGRRHGAAEKISKRLIYAAQYP